MAIANAEFNAADFDDGGAVNITDAINTFSYLFTGGPPPAAPSPSVAAYLAEDCGPDPTPDTLDCVEESEKCDA